MAGAASYLPPVVVQVLAEIGKFQAGMGEVKAEMSGLEAAATKMAAVGKVALAGLAAGATAVAYESVKLAMNFDQQMEVIHTQAGASTADMKLLRQGVLDLAPAVGIGPEELARGLYHIASAAAGTNTSAATQLDYLAAAAKLAKIGMADLDTVTYALSGVMAVGMKDVTSATDAIAWMNQTVGMGDMRMEDLARAIGTGVLPAFKTAGLTMADFSAALATITDNSTPADEAATRLRMTIGLMSAPTNKAAEALKAIGIDAAQAADIFRTRDIELKSYGISASQLASDMQQPHGLLVALVDLKDHLGNLDTVQQKAVLEHIFGGAKTSGTVETLLDEIDKLTGKYNLEGDAQSRAAAIDQAWQDQQQQAKQKWDDLVAKVQTYGVKIGDWLIPKIEDAVDWTSKHKDAAKDLADVIGGVLAVAIAAYTTNMIAAAAANIAATWEFLLVAAAIGAVIYEIEQMNSWLKDSGLTWGDFFKILADEIDNWIYQHVAPAYNKLVDFANFIDRLSGGKGDTPHLGAPKQFEAPPQAAIHFKGQSGPGYFPAFAQGGVVPGPTGAPLLAIVHGGETVIPNGGGGGGDQVIHLHLNLDNKEVWQGQLRYARQSGQTPAQLYPSSAKAI